jgi:uncharacterized membrane protein
MDKNPITYPVSGLLSLIVGLIIINAGLNVHSGEIFLWLIGIFGFILLVPIILLAKSIQILAIKMKDEKSKIKTYTLILTVLLALSWVTLVTVGIWNEM